MKVMVETSARHVHVSEADLKTLFGADAKLTVKKELSQPGQYASNEKVEVIGPKGSLVMSILGPTRPETQVEVALTDARKLGIAAPIRESGDLEGTPGCTLKGPAGEVVIEKGVIAAKRHIHFNVEEAAAAGVESVKPGDIHTVELDRLMSNDGTTHLTVDMYNNKLKNPHIADTSKLVFIVDHNVPSDCPKTAASQKKMRDFAKANHIDFWEGKGVCHQIMMENYVRPGELIFGADSHTCSYGALGAFGTGVGCTDFLYGMVTGTSWVMVPETVKFNLVGKLPEGVYARDLILTIIGEVGANGCNYQVMEFTGEGAKTLTISDRIALCNMAVEAGAKTGIFEVDDVAMEYLKEHGREPKAVYHSDPDAHYVREYTFDLSKVEPVVAKPDFVDNLAPAKDVRGIKIDEAFLGSCNNGRIEDLRVGAQVIKGKKVSEKVRFLVVPASQTIYRQALEEGLIDIFMDAGAIVMNPNCSVCWGSCQGVIGENEVLISTGTRNFKGRAGHPSSKVYLGSAATVTASAIAGEIALASDV